MTNTEAAVLQAKWARLIDPPPCAHLNQELESRDGVYLTGNYYCSDCGEAVTCA